MRKKRILIHSLIFNPDGVSTAYLYGDIALSLQKAGHEVVVLTTTPHYNIVESQIKKQPLKWKLWGIIKKSDFNGIEVYHVPQKKFKSTILRLFGFVYWHIVSFFTALFIKKIDVILSPSPPLTIGLLNIVIGKIKGAKVIYNVQEVYPDILGNQEGITHKVLSKMEHYIYDHSDCITTIDNIFKDTIIGRFKNPTKLKVIPNFVDTEIYRPLKAWNNLKKNLFLDNGNLKVLYAGNIGMAQDWDTLLKLAKETLDRPIDFYVIGEGVMKNYLEEQIINQNLTNLHLLPYQPRELMPEIIAFSDIQFIFMEPKIAAQGFPSKVYTIMACGKPLIVCSPQNTPIVNFLSEIECAKLVTKEDVVEKVTEIIQWLEGIDDDQLQKMGQRGFEEVKCKYSKEVVTEEYTKLISSL